MDVAPRAGRGARVGRVEVQVLCSGTWDAAPSLLLTVERSNRPSGYLINCGEGTARFCSEHKMRLTTYLCRVLFTRQTWEAIGGLPDVLMSRFAEREKELCNARVHGLARLPQLIGGFNEFVRREALPQVVSSSPEDWPDSMERTFEESGIDATPLLLDPEAAAAAAAEEAEDPVKCQRTDDSGRAGDGALRRRPARYL